jgi:sugar/nucleoside kinase (ribokinase family)
MRQSLIIGAAFVDVMVAVPKLPTSGEDVSGHFQGNIVGGSAFNVYGAVKYAGERADLFVPVGTGQYADVVREEMVRRRIPIKLAVGGADNGWDISFVEPDGERSFLTITGVEQLWRDEWFNQIAISDYDSFYLSGYEMEDYQAAAVILRALKKCKPGSQILFDASPRIQYLPKQTIEALVAMGVMIHCNEDELSWLITGKASLEAKCHQLYERTHAPVIVTLGGRGAYFFNGTESGLIESPQVTVINTLGAGDTFCGGFLAGLADNLSIKEAVKKASQLASLVVGQESGTLLDRMK